MDEAKRSSNAIRQERHKYALMTEVRQIRAELQDLRAEVQSVLAAHPREAEQEKNHAHD